MADQFTQGGTQLIPNGDGTFRAGNKYGSMDPMTQTVTTSPAPSNSSSSGFYKYQNDPTVYNASTNQAYSNPQDFFNAGGAQDFSNVQTRPQPTNNISVNPTNQTDTQALSNTPTTNNDIQALLAKNISASNDFFANKLPQYVSNINTAGTVGPAELALQQKQAQYNAQVNEASGQASGLINPNDQAIPLDFLQGQGRAKLFMAQNAAALNQAQLQYAQGNREVAFQTAKDVFSSNLQAVQSGTQNLGSLIDLYQKTAPQNIGNPIVDKNGNATQVIRDPFTGKVTTLQIGNVGQPQGQYTSGVIGTHYDPLTNSQVPTYGLINTSTGTYQPIAGSSFPSSPVPNYTTTPLDTSLPASSPGSVSIPQVQGSTPAGQQQLAYLNNNPGNLVFAGQAGASQGVGGFAHFDSPEAGYQALIKQIQLDQSRGETLGQYINKYAPPSSNNTAQYLQQASAALGANANTPLSSISAANIAAFQAKKESGTTLGTQSSKNPAVSQAEQNIVSVFPQLNGKIQDTAFGHTFVDTTQIDPSLAQRATGLYGNGQIAAFDPDTTKNVKSISATYNGLTNNLEPLLSALPDQALSLDQLNNFFKSTFQTDPKLAALKDSWTLILGDLQSQIGTQGISRLATGSLSNSDQAILPSVLTPRATAQAMINQAKSLLANRENTIFGGPPPPPNPTTFNNQVMGNMTNTDPSLSIVNNILGTGSGLNILSGNPLSGQLGGGPSVDINRALSSGGLS